MKPWLRILFMLIVSGTATAARPPTLAGFVDTYAREHAFSGTVLVQRHGRVEYARSFGMANLEFGVRNGAGTRYAVASITKAFTSVLILRLVEEGRIDLAQPIATYLPDHPGAGARTVTVHQLLNHTSGLPNIDRIPNIEAVDAGIAAALDDAREHGRLPLYQTPYTSDQLYAKFCTDAPVRTPGTAFDYNNADYIILGKIVERLHGKRYDDVLRDEILVPLKLADTGMLYHRDVVPNLAPSYSYGADGRTLERDLPVYPENWYAAGAMYSSANDVLAFANALFGGKLLRRETLARMTAPGLDNYGYGVWAYDMTIAGKTYRAVKRPGRIMGVRAELFRIDAADLTIVMLANTGAADLDSFVAALARRIVGGAPAP